MKKQSWPTLSGPKGFSLIELLVVVAIIGFLSAIGMAVYADVQAKGRDAKRKADVDSIAKVIEIHKTDVGGYQPLDLTWFGSSNGIPLADPKGKLYCIQSNSTNTPITNAGSSGWSDTACPSGYEAVAASSTPTSGDNVWKVCTLLEKPIDGSYVYCRYSVQ